MRLHRLFSIGLVALTAVLISTLTVQAATANKRPFIVPEHCNTIRAFFVGHRLELITSGDDDDACGFTVRTSFADRFGGRLDLPFASHNIFFNLEYADGSPTNDPILVRVFAEQGPLGVFFQQFSFNPFFNFDLAPGGINNPDEIQVAVNDFRGNTIFVTNIHITPNYAPSLDTVHVDDALACD